MGWWQCPTLIIWKKGHTVGWSIAVVVGKIRSGQGFIVVYELRLPPALQKARWKVKIRDKENREPPHVTIIRGTES